MTKKEVLRKVWSVFFWLWLSLITAKFLLGKADTFSTVCMFLCYSVLALELILSIVLKIVKFIMSYILYKTYTDGLTYLKAVHKERYKLYFTESKEKVEEYSAEIERYGTAMLEAGERAISNNLLSQKYTQRVQEILEQTKKLMTTVN